MHLKIPERVFFTLLCIGGKCPLESVVQMYKPFDVMLEKVILHMLEPFA